MGLCHGIIGVFGAVVWENLGVRYPEANLDSLTSQKRKNDIILLSIQR
jgi:hypothetical protein